MEVYVAIEGIPLPSGYILKELAFIFQNEEYGHFLFMRPRGFRLTAKDEKTVRFITCNMNNISFDDGDIPYEQARHILEKIRHYKVYTYSDLAQKVLQEYLPTTVIINTQELGFQLQSDLPDPLLF